jgi:predicted small secreted protein
MSILRNAFVFAALAVLGLGLAACNTVQGAGEDLENAGEAVQDAAT